MSGLVTRDKGQGPTTCNTNLLLISDARADSRNRNMNLSLQHSKEGGVRARRKLVSIHRNSSALEDSKPVARAFRERNTYKDESSSLDPKSTSAARRQGTLDTQSLGPFDVAPWTSQAPTTFPTALLERPMSIKNMPIVTSISQPKLG